MRPTCEARCIQASQPPLEIAPESFPFDAAPGIMSICRHSLQGYGEVRAML
jgi:hypothetical protein